MEGKAGDRIFLLLWYHLFRTDFTWKEYLHVERTEEMNVIYFTADQHLGHRAVINMQERPFEDVQEMNRVIISNYNAMVGSDDTVYLLGDICHRIPVEEANKLIDRLKGKKILIKGNHDKRYDPALFEEITDFKTIALNGVNIALMHYPMLSWPKSHHGSLQLHGHVHGNRQNNEANRDAGIRRFDVGVDANDFYPVSINQILTFFGI